MTDDAAREEWRAYCQALPERCAQCGRAWAEVACGPTHAAIDAARSALTAPKGAR